MGFNKEAFETMRFVYSDAYVVDLGHHPFFTWRYLRLRDEVVRELGARVVEARAPDWEEMRGFLRDDYLEDLRLARPSPRTLRSELPVREDVINWQRTAAGGTRLALELALEDGGAFHIGGGFHHAYPDHAEGFCYINDIAWALLWAHRRGLVARSGVFDLDLHQGNGTAFYFSKFITEYEIYTVSIHEEDNYPWPKERSWLDVPLRWRTPPKEYLELVAGALGALLEQRPQVVIYQAGVDTSRFDLLGHQLLSEEDLARRDQMVLGSLAEAGVPFVVTLGGGYPDPPELLTRLQLNTARMALRALGA